jgi:hypothetical protein
MRKTWREVGRTSDLGWHTIAGRNYWEEEKSTVQMLIFVLITWLHQDSEEMKRGGTDQWRKAARRWVSDNRRRWWVVERFGGDEERWDRSMEEGGTTVGVGQ